MVADSTGREALLRAYRHAHRRLPAFVHEKPEAAEKAFAALSPEDRADCINRIERYAAACKQARAALLVSDRIPVAPFGPIWGGLRSLWLCGPPIAQDIPLDLRNGVAQSFDVLRRRSDAVAQAWLERKGVTLDADGGLVFPSGFEQMEAVRRTRDAGWPEVNALHALARERKRGVAEAWAARLADLCEPVPVGSDLFREWARHEDASGFPPLPEPGNQPVVYFPKGGPQGLETFKAAATAARNQRRQDHDHAA